MSRTRARWIAVILLAVYALGVAAVALWPVPVDRGMGPFLTRVMDAVPWLTYGGIEFTANIVFFVPFGALLALAQPARPGRAAVALLVSALVSAAIEGVQLLLPERTASLADIMANVAGAGLGILLAAAIRGADAPAEPEESPAVLEPGRPGSS